MAVTIEVGAGHTVDDCDSKLVPNISLFWCLVTAGGCDELAIAEVVGGCNMLSLGVGVLVQTRVTSFVGPLTLGEGV